jgi:hypothetical protein
MSKSGHLLAMVLAIFCAAFPAYAQETVCARVKIEIKQKLTLERQAFDAEMRINNTTDTEVIENVAVVVHVTDELGVPVLTSSDSNDLNAKFFIRVSSKQGISDVDGAGVVNPKTTGVVNWLLIPAPGAAGNNSLGKKYLVGATLTYKFGGETHTMEVSPDVVTVNHCIAPDACIATLLRLAGEVARRGIAGELEGATHQSGQVLCGQRALPGSAGRTGRTEVSTSGAGRSRHGICRQLDSDSGQGCRHQGHRRRQEWRFGSQ